MNDLMQTLLQNQFLQVGMIFGFVGMIYRPIKSILNQLFKIIKRQFIYTLHIVDTEDSFFAAQLWISQQQISKKAKQCDFTKLRSSELIPDQSSQTLKKVVGTGIHFFWFQKSFFTLYKYKSRSTQTSDTRIEYYFYIISWNKNIIDELLKEFNKCLGKKKYQVDIYNHDKYNGFKSTPISIRYNYETNNLIPPKEATSLIKDIESFRNNADYFLNNNIPYKRGYLFLGPPGNGKSTFVKYLASKYNYDIKNINLDNCDQINYIYDGLENSIGLIEDIDRLYSSIEKEKVGQQNLSTILNILDGVNTPHGTIFILTCNDITKLPSALLRTGRIDQKLFFDNPDRDQLQTLISRFFRGYHYDLNLIDRVWLPHQGSFSLYKGFILENLSNPERLFDQEIFNDYLKRNK